MRQRIPVFFALLIIICVGCQSKPKSITVLAASDLTNVFREIASDFEREKGTKITLVFGSTGQLAQQIEQGAPADVFAAANVTMIDELERAGLIVAGSKRTYAIGRIALWTRHDKKPDIERIEDLVRDDVKRIAIANPDHAPYGIAAREALQTAGIWEKIKPRIIFAENINQTLQYGVSGNVDAAIVALSLCNGSNGVWTVVPDNLHKQISQSMAIIKTTQNEARARSFEDYVVSTSGRTKLQSFGFVVP